MTRIPVPALDEVPTASKKLLEWIMQTQPTGEVLNISAPISRRTDLSAKLITAAPSASPTRCRRR